MSEPPEPAVPDGDQTSDHTIAEVERMIYGPRPERRVIDGRMLG